MIGPADHEYASRLGGSHSSTWQRTTIPSKPVLGFGGTRNMWRITTIIGVAFPGKQVIEKDVGLGEASPFRFVAADTVEQIQHRVLLLVRVDRRCIDQHLAATAI